MFKMDLEKARNQRSNCQHPLDYRKRKKVPPKIYFCFIDYVKSFDYVDHNILRKILQEMGIPDHLTCVLRNLYAGQEATGNRLVPSQERNISRLYIITLFI